MQKVKGICVPGENGTAHKTYFTEMGEMMKFYLPTKVYQEKDAVKMHSAQMARLGKKALIVTGGSSSKKNGALQDVTDGLDLHHTAYVIFDKIKENPSVDSIMEAAEFGGKEGTDFVIGVGGGSPLDAAKAIALMLQNRDSSREVLYQKVELRHLPVVAVPTTCGTGSEVTPYAILTREDLQTKQSISHMVFPELALVDGKYIEWAPLSLLINTAVDALGHMIESYFHSSATDYSRMLCQYAMEVWGMAADVLFGIDAKDGDYDRLMFASSLAGMAIAQTGTSLPHGLSYYLTYHKGIPHGKAVGVFLAGYLSALPEHFEPQVVMALRTLGFGSLEQFEGALKELLGIVKLSEAETSEMIGEMMQNDKKLLAAPFEVTEEILQEMCRMIAKK